MYKKFKLNRTKIEGAISCQSEGGQVSLVFSVLYIIPLLQDENDKQSVTLRYQQFQEIPLSKNTLLRESTVDNME